MGCQIDRRTVKARDHRREERLGLKLIEVERMACPVGNQGKEGHLRSAIALAKGMDRVERCEERRSFFGKHIGWEATKVVLRFQTREQRPHLLADVLGIAEDASAFAEPNSPGPSGPGVQVLKEMAVNGAIVGDRQPACWKRFVGALGRGGRLKEVQFILGSKSWDIPENR